MDTAQAEALLAVDPNHCPVETTVAAISGRWKALILWHLNQGPARFNALRRLIPGVTQRMLTANLRELEIDGLVERRVLGVVPPHVEYSISARGLSLMPILGAMALWGQALEDERDRAAVAA